MKPKVLIVDDVDAMRQMLRAIVEGLGLQVLEASNGKQTLETIAKSGAEIGLILLDIELPDMKAFDILGRLKQQPGSMKGKICLVSGHREKEAVTQALALGANDFIVKPVDVRVVTDRIAKLLNIQTQTKATGRVAAKLPATVISLPDQIALNIVEISGTTWIAKSPIEFKSNLDLVLKVPGLKRHIGFDYNYNARILKCQGKAGEYVLELQLVGIPERFANTLKHLAERGRAVA